MLEKTRESLHLAHECGVTFAIGTDSGFAMTPYGEWHAKELELLMKYAGFSELEAIQAATWNGGVVLNLEGQVGAVAPGMLADVLVVDGDPSQDITVLQDHDRIETIILDGEIVEIDRSVKSWPNEPSYTYAGRYLTQQVAREAIANQGGEFFGYEIADHTNGVPVKGAVAAPIRAPDNTVPPSARRGNPIAE
jgi:adenine deaminase